MSDSTVAGTRPYVSTVREEQAAVTRARIVSAARECFEQSGWSGTTLARIAQRAGVSPQAVHLSVGPKPVLLRAALTSAVAGGDGEGTGSQDATLETYLFGPALRPGLAPRRRARLFAVASVEVHRRVGGLFEVLAQAAQTDPDLAGWRTEIAGRRLALCRSLVDATDTVTRARRTRVADLVFLTSSTSLYDGFAARGWTLQAYTTWLTGELTRLLEGERR